MRILFCASESAPYAKTGGLADVIGALPKALQEKGNDVRVIMPYYKKIKDKKIGQYKGYAYIRIADKMEYVGIFHDVHDGINFYFVDNYLDIYNNIGGFGIDGIKRGSKKSIS